MSTTTTEYPDVQDAQRRMGRKPAKPNRTVRIDEDLAKMVEYIVMRREVATAAYLSPMIREQVEADYASEFEAQQREFRQSRKKPPQ
jgi:hypothetical protein